MSDSLKQRVLAAGFDRVGICRVDRPFDSAPFYNDWIEAGWHAGMDYLASQATLKASVESVLPGAKCAIVAATNYAPAEPISNGVAAYAQHRDYHIVLRKRWKRVVAQLEEEFPTEKFRIAIDSAPVLERELGHRAGLGWFGKNTLLIDSRTGSYFLLSCLLTTADLVPDAPSHGGCGTCLACIDACPTGAIRPLNGRWAVDSRQCLSYWTIEHKTGLAPPEIEQNRHGWVFGCDICQQVCPFNQPRANQPDRARPTSDPDFIDSGLTRDKLAGMDEAEWELFSRGRPLRRQRRELIQLRLKT